MTTVLVLERSPRRMRVEGILRWAVLVVLATGLPATAQDPVHWLNAGAMPPGAIGSLRLHRGGPLPGYFQPVRIRAPQGARIALAMEGGFSNAESNDVLVGLQIGPVYRLQVSDIPNANGLELYPTIEVIDRTYPPPCLALKFPIPIELTQEELELAARGAFVTRVIYLEEPQQALPISRKVCDEQPWIEAPSGEDPLVTADRLGRPVAILRIGGRVPGAIDSINGGQWRAGVQDIPAARAMPGYDNDNSRTDRDSITVRSRMTTSTQLDHAAPPADQLPVWWRCMLIAIATVILCACSGPVTRTHLAPDKALSQPQLDPRIPPTLPPGVASDLPCDGGQCPCGCGCHDPYGPVAGPGDEYLCDGGDFVTPAGVQEDWSIVGLEQEDAIGHYDTLDGRTIVTPSNRVCIYSPRFAAVRRLVQPIAYEQPVFINQTIEEAALAKAAEVLPPISQFQRHKVSVDVAGQPPNIFRQRQQAGGFENLLATMEAFNSIAVQANLAIIRTGEVSNAEKALVERLSQAAIAWTGVQAPQVVFGMKQAHAEVGVKQPGIIYQTDGPDHPRLRLVKLASCSHAAPGEEVEFTLRYDNIGDQEIGNVTIVDNLSTRLEYVPDSAKSSVDADFITQSNDAGSLILRWEIRDAVKPGDGGVLRFRVKVR